MTNELNKYLTFPLPLKAHLDTINDLFDMRYELLREQESLESEINMLSDEATELYRPDVINPLVTNAASEMGVDEDKLWLDVVLYLCHKLDLPERT